mmetsp:Transcript_14824/g.42294  ORF Transcript_14824/g.42294 Transcript_14824/m.42294 type:complete len:219 (+) Transcript_14824:593-1249(+)
MVGMGADMTAAACLAVSAVSAVFIVILDVVLVVIFFAPIIPPIVPPPHTRPKIPQLDPPRHPILLAEQERVLTLDVPVPDPTRVQVADPLQHVPHDPGHLPVGEVAPHAIQVAALRKFGCYIKINSRMNELAPNQTTLSHRRGLQKRRAQLQHVWMAYATQHSDLPQDQLGLSVVSKDIRHALQSNHRIAMTLRDQLGVDCQTHHTEGSATENPFDIV